MPLPRLNAATTTRRPPTAPVEPAPSATHMAVAPTSVQAAAELITPAEAGRLLGVSAKVLERWRSLGGGPAFVRLTRKTIRYRHGDILAYVAERVRANTAA